MLVRGRIRRVLQFKHLHRCLSLPVDTTQRRKNSTLWLSRTKIKIPQKTFFPLRFLTGCLMIAWSFSTFVDWMQVVVATMSLPECARPSTSGHRRLQGDFKACLVGGDLSVTAGLLDLCLSFYIYSWTQSVWTNSCITTRLWSVTLQWNLKRVVSVSFSGCCQQQICDFCKFITVNCRVITNRLHTFVNFTVLNPKLTQVNSNSLLSAWCTKVPLKTCFVFPRKPTRSTFIVHSSNNTGHAAASNQCFPTVTEA